MGLKKLNFTKMHGCGNDYIYINCFNQVVENPNKLSSTLSNRRFQVGSDGIILICPSEKADVLMRVFNADGSEAKMCGNGIRCVGKYINDVGMTNKDVVFVETLSGVKELLLTREKGVATLIKVDMGKAILTPSDIPVNLNRKSTKNFVINEPIKIDDTNINITCVSMGNPHCVVFLEDIKNLDLAKIGTKFEKNEIFPEQVNTEFVHVIDKHNLQVRVWERGSGETLSCGTGACASVVAAVLNGFCKKNEDVKVHLQGGDLTVCYTDKSVFMTGGATKVFDATIDVGLYS